MYKLKGFVFREVGGEVKRIPIIPEVLIEDGWNGAFALMEKIGVSHYLLSIEEVEG